MAQETELSIDDCGKCHTEEPREIAARGAAHESAVDCLACHESHRPMAANNIPACGDCHAGDSHYELDECLSCHNPHAPLDVVLEGEHKEVCLSCHATPGEELAANPSMHSEMACNFCHADQHGMIPECVECHAPHSSDMVQEDCSTCHQAHEPTVLAYDSAVPSQQCGACHSTALDELSANKSKHRDMSCVSCHADRHGTVPACNECHGQPHAESMHQKFPECGQCHNTAHNLNN
ncbi:MAG: hypothetical protein R6V08_09395 [Desulfuromonadales bacterium]